MRLFCDREEELRQIRRAQEFSYVEYQASSPQAAGPAPTSPLQAGGTEEEQLAYALQLSALEAQQSPPPRMQSPQEQEAEALAEREEEELAMALSLSLAEVQDASRVLNSDDESDAESITPPNSPYQGTTLFATRTIDAVMLADSIPCCLVFTLFTLDTFISCIGSFAF